MKVKDNVIHIKPIESPRKGWKETFKRMQQNQDDASSVEDSLDNELLEAWDED